MATRNDSDESQYEAELDCYQCVVHIKVIYTHAKTHPPHAPETNISPPQRRSRRHRASDNATLHLHLPSKSPHLAMAASTV